MNTHKESIKIGDTVSYLNQGEYEVVGLSTMMPDDPGEPEWKITHTIKEVAIADIHKGITYQKPCWVSIKDVALLEPTPPSQIEEDPKIVQIAPVFTDKFNYLFGLGADGKPYYWDAKEEYWRYYDDQYGRHLDWELEQKFKEVNNTK